MQLCIELARVAKRSGDAPVGALIVRDGHVMAEAVKSVKAHLDITAHPEIEAIGIACHSLTSLNLSGCVLYTTAAPYWLCSYAIRQTGISEVVIGAPVLRMGGVTSMRPILSDPRDAGDDRLVVMLSACITIGAHHAREIDIRSGLRRGGDPS